MKSKMIFLLLIVLALLATSACVRPYYLSKQEQDSTNKSLDYRIERAIITAKIDTDTYVVQAWLEIRNYSPDKAVVTIDCRFYDNDLSPNDPITNKVRTITLEPWQVRTEPFAAMVLPPFDISAWCGMVDSDLVSTANTNKKN